MIDDNKRCCKVEAIVSVDERGQMILPKDLRDKSGIKPGDKFALVTFSNDGQFCCLSLIRVEKLGSMVREILIPVISQIGE